MALGTLGTVVFEASSELIRTFSDLTQTTSSRWASHEVIGQKPKQEHLGPALRTMRLSMSLRVEHGVDPETETAALRASTEDGEVLSLVLGGVPRGQWVITDLREAPRHISAGGVARTIDLELSLEEYA